MLANAQVAQLGLLEIRVYPDVAQRANGHDTLASLEVVAGIHITACDNAHDSLRRTQFDLYRHSINLGRGLDARFQQTLSAYICVHLRLNSLPFYSCRFASIRGSLFSAMGGQRRFRGSLARNLNRRRG